MRMMRIFIILNSRLFHFRLCFVVLTILLIVSEKVPTFAVKICKVCFSRPIQESILLPESCPYITDELFDIQDKIIMVNVEGFIKYTAIYEGNKADSKTLGAMIDHLVSATTVTPAGAAGKKRIVVIDAGIATEENLQMITDRKYDYVCVSRSSLKKYTVAEGISPVVVYDHRDRPIELVQVQTPNATDSEYYLKVSSPTKALKESSMHNKFCDRYEQGLAQIKKGIVSKGGVKKYGKVNQRLGRLAQKYSSTHSLYEVSIEKNKKDVCTSMTWKKKEQTTLIYDALQMKPAPFIRKKSVVLKIEPMKSAHFDLQKDTS